MNDTHTFPLRYESLACFIFECGRNQDPMNIADADFWVNFHNPTNESKKVLNSIIDVAIFRFEAENALLQQLLLHKENIEKIETVYDAGKWVNDVLLSLSGNGYSII